MKIPILDSFNQIVFANSNPAVLNARFSYVLPYEKVIEEKDGILITSGKDKKNIPFKDLNGISVYPIIGKYGMRIFPKDLITQLAPRCDIKLTLNIHEAVKLYGLFTPRVENMVKRLHTEFPNIHTETLPPSFGLFSWTKV